MAVAITPLWGSGFGAEVTGADLAGPISDDLADQLRFAFRDHPVLVMRTDGLTSEQLLALAQVFGEPQVQLLEDYRSSDTPAISIVAVEAGCGVQRNADLTSCASSRIASRSAA